MGVWVARGLTVSSSTTTAPAPWCRPTKSRAPVPGPTVAAPTRLVVFSNVMSWEREVDRRAVQAARKLLVVRSRDTRAPNVRVDSPNLPDSQSPCWRARCIHTRGVDSRHVTDARHGGYIGSFIRALDFRDEFHRKRGVPIPREIAAVVDGKRVAPEVVRRRRAVVVRWQGQEHVVTGDDAEEIATEIVALDLFVEFLTSFRDCRAGAAPPTVVRPLYK